MTSVNYNLGIPAKNNNPSIDQPNMQTNTNSIYALLTQDHIGKNDINGGRHNIIHFVEQLTDPVAIAVPPIGQLYTKNISADSELFFESANAKITQLTNQGTLFNGVQVFINFNGTVAGNNAVQIIRNSFNVTQVTRIGTNTGKYQIDFTNALPSNNYTVVFGAQRSASSNFVYGGVLGVAYATAVTTTTLQIGFTSDGSSFHDVNMGNVLIFGG